MAIAVSRFAWEDVAEPQGVWQHTEYTLELRLRLAPGGEGEGGAAGAAEAAEAAFWSVRRRYSDFEACRAGLAGRARGLPELPPKEPWLQRALGSFAARLAWQEQRRGALLAYVEALLQRPDLHPEPCVQRLLALGPARLLTAPPSAPASIRLRPLPARAAEEAEGPEPGTVEVVVQQATAGSLDDEAATSEVPVAQIVVAFREVRGAGEAAGEEEASCTLSLPVQSLTSEVRAAVALTPGQAYIVEAHSVSVAGLRSAPVVVSTLVPPPEPPLEPPHGEGAAEAGDAAAGEACAGAAQRREAAAWRLRGASFRGHAAAEYVAAASEKARQAYARAPYRLISEPAPAYASPRGEGSPGRPPPEATKQHVLVEVERAEGAAAAAEERTVHRDAELLDSERTAIQQQRRFDEACAVAAWMAELTGRAELSGPLEEDMTALRDALVSGEVLCELVNAAVADGAEGAGAESLPIPFYHRKPSTRFRSLENVSLFLGACRGYFGVPEHQLFCAGDIAGGRDMHAVVQCLLALRSRINAMYPAPGSTCLREV